MRTIAPCLISALAALALGCGSSQSTAPAQPEAPPRPAVSADWREVVPAGPQAVVGMNITRLSRSPLVEAVVESIAAQDAEVAKTLDMLREIGSQCNMDFSRDIHSVVVAFYGNDQPGSAAVAAVIKGSFDEATIEDCATRMAQRMNSALSTTEISGYKVYSSPDAKDSGVACVPMPNLMIVASNQEIMTGMLAAESPRFGSERTELSALLFDLPQDRSLWGAGIVPAESQVVGYMQQATSGALSQPPRAGYGHAELQDGIEGQGGLVMASGQDASILLDWASNQIAAIRPLLASQGLGSLLDSLTLGAKGERLTVSLSLSAEQIHTLMQIAQ